MNFKNQKIRNDQIREFKPLLVPAPIGDFNFINNLRPPYVLEIGSGTGDFAIAYSKMNPQIPILAVEKTKNKFKKFSDRLLTEKIKYSNLFACHANAINLVAHHIKSQSLSECYINYPNPYPKESQCNKRFYRMPFFGYLLTRMVPSGRIHFATNLFETMNEAKFYLLDYWGLSLVQEESLGSRDEPMTAFERKYLARGETCWRLTFCLK